MDDRQRQIIKECERFGESEVRRKLYSGEYTGSQDRLLVEGWLRDIESKREQELESRRETRDEEMLHHTRSAKKIAFAAMIIAIIATIIALLGIIK